MVIISDFIQVLQVLFKPTSLVKCCFKLYFSHNFVLLLGQTSPETTPLLLRLTGTKVIAYFTGTGRPALPPLLRLIDTWVSALSLRLIEVTLPSLSSTEAMPPSLSTWSTEAIVHVTCTGTERHRPHASFPSFTGTERHRPHISFTTSTRTDRHRALHVIQLCIWLVQ